MSSPTQPDFHTVIVGAGPSGTAAATLLAKAGKSVCVVDKATFPRDKCCGDGLTTLALRELEKIGFVPSTVASWKTIHSARLRSPSGREVEVPRPSGQGQYAAVATRLDLDAALVEHARNAGAEIRENCEFLNITAENNFAVISFTDGTSVTAQHVIAADGMWSPVRKSLGLLEEGYLGEWHAFRQYATNITGPAQNGLYVWFEPDLLPGYAWSFPLADGKVNIGFGVLRDGKRRIQTMKHTWEDLLTRPHIVQTLGEGFTLVDRHTAWPIPANITSAVLHHRNVMFVGDAARATDTLTGEGIGQALLTGVLAAQAILDPASHSASESAAIYAKHARQHLAADHHMSSLLSKMLSRPLIARGAVRIVGLNNWTRSNFARWMFEDEARAVALTPRRWHRKFLKQRGAY